MLCSLMMLDNGDNEEILFLLFLFFLLIFGEDFDLMLFMMMACGNVGPGFYFSLSHVSSKNLLFF